MIALFRNLANWWVVVLAVTLSKAPLAESVKITLEPDNPTKVLLNSEAVLQWNYSLGVNYSLREVDFFRASVGTDDSIGFIEPTLLHVYDSFKEHFELRRPATLVIHNVTADDTSEYTVKVKEFKLSSGIKLEDSTIHLEVLVPVSLISTPTNKTINETDTAAFFCNASGNPAPTITWFRDGQTMGTGNTLSFTAVRNHSGNYLCSADNGLNVIVNASAYLDVQFKPENTRLSVDTSNITAVLLGSTVVFNCTTTAHPVTHVYRFYHNKVLLGSNVTGLYYLEISESGVYSCTPVNDAGVEEVSATVNLTVVDPPQVTVTPASVIVLEGNNATLTCNASGIPSPVIAWSITGTAVVLSHNEVLTVVNITRPGTPSEELHYQCTATNGIGNATVDNTTITVHYPCKIYQAPSNKTIIESNNVTLHCNATGNPAPNITWTKDSSPTVLHQGEVYTITNISRHQHSNYKCSAWNGVGQVAKASFSINVLYEPAISVQKCPGPVTEGGNATLYCNATGNPAPNIAWIRQDTGVILSSNEELVITAVNRSQSGSYQCHASNSIGNNSTGTCSLDVLYLPIETSMAMTPSNTTVLRGSTVSLNCSTDANPVAHVYQFYFNDSYIGNSSLGVFNVTVDADGVYTCVPINTVGTGHNATVNITAVDTPTVDVYPTSFIVVKGNNITLSCNASGKPQPAISWTKVGESGQVLSQNSTLTVTNISRPGSPDNMIQYQCAASNGVGNTAIAVANITVHYEPTASALTTVPSNTTVLRRSTVSLNCSTDANPVARVYQFYFNDSYIGNSSSGVFNITVDGDGVYTCVPINTVGTGHNATLNITAVVAPVAKVTPQTFTVVEGGNITLTCNVSGVPTPLIYWTRIGHSGVLSRNSSLTVINVTRPGTHDNMIQYQCTASNGVESPATAVSNITVHYKPTISALTTVPSNTTVLRGSTVSLNCTTDANPDAHMYQFYFNNSYIGNSSSGVFNITVDADGVYTCVPISTVDTGHNATVNITAVVAPVAKVTPQTFTVVEGGNITLICNVSGVPTPLIHWTRIGHSAVLSRNSSLTVMNVSRPGTHDNMIQYQCTASNGVEIPATAVSNITVHYDPGIVVAPSNTTIIEGDSAILFCNTTGSPEPNVTWIKTGANTSLSSSETLRLDNLTRVDDGTEYKCIVTNYLRSVEASAVVTVYYHSVIESSPVNHTVLEGTNVTLHCNATGDPAPNITWTKDGSPTVLYQGDTYSIVNIQRQAAGHYTCSAWNGVGEHTNATATVTIHYESVIDMALNNITAVEKDNITLHCNATGNPAPNITWTKDGSPTVLHQGDTYSIVNIQRQAAGHYTCTAWNGVGEHTNATAAITVRSRGTPPNIVVVEGNNATLHCNIIGNFTRNVTWTKRGSVTVLHDGDRFILNNITRQQAGIYICSAWNKTGSKMNITVTVTVHYPSLIETRPLNQTVLEGTNVTLHCNATGNPTPNITWTKDGSPTVLYQGDTYSIVNIQRQAAGHYTCTAWNGVSEYTNATATVTIHYPPEIVTFPVDQVVWVGQQVNFSCDVIGNPVPNISYTIVGQNGSVGSGKMLVINSSSKAYVKTYTCIAKNGIQPSVSANATVTVLVRPCSQSPCFKGSCIDVKDSTYICTCDYGYQGTSCDKPILPKTDTVEGQVTLKKDKYKYHPDYQNHSSELFKNLSASFSKIISALYKDEPQFGHVKVNEITNGSVVVNFTLVFIKGNKTVENLIQVLEDSVNNGSLPVEKETLRLVLPPTTTPPTTVKALPPSVGARRASLASWIIAVLAAIGGLVFLVFVCAIIHCCVRKKRKQGKEDICQQYEDDTGKWIDLPHVAIKKRSVDCEHAYTGPEAYAVEGPTVRDPANQQNGIGNGIHDRPPAVLTRSGVKFTDQASAEANGTTTPL